MPAHPKQRNDTPITSVRFLLRCSQLDVSRTRGSESRIRLWSTRTAMLRLVTSDITVNTTILDLNRPIVLDAANTTSVQQMRVLAGRSRQSGGTGADRASFHQLTTITIQYNHSLMRMNGHINCLDLTAKIRPPARLITWSTVQVGKVCHALACHSRRKILNLLRMGPHSVGEIACAIEMISRPAVSQHLRILLEANLVTYETRGGRTFYRLDLRGLEHLRNYIAALEVL
jgi:DNA-binding transcriptional ArsR family regulator